MSQWEVDSLNSVQRAMSGTLYLYQRELRGQVMYHRMKQRSKIQIQERREEDTVMGRTPRSYLEVQLEEE